MYNFNFVFYIDIKNYAIDLLLILFVFLTKTCFSNINTYSNGKTICVEDH